MLSSTRSHPLLGFVAITLLVAIGCSDDGPTATTQPPPDDPEPHIESESPWQRTVGSASHDESHDIAVDPDGNVFIVGATNGPIDFGGQPFDNTDGPVFLAKYNALGEFLWVKNVPGAVGDGPLHLGADNTGSVVLQGLFLTNMTIDGTTIKSAGGADHVFVARFDGSGNLLWIGHDRGSYQSVAFGMDTGLSGGTAVTGFIKAGATFGETELTVQGFDFFVASYDADGNALWAKQTGTSTSVEGRAVAVDPSNNIFVTGGFWQTITFDDVKLTNTTSRDAFIVKYNAEGDVAWAIMIGNENDVVPYGIATDNNGDVYVMGFQWGANTALWKFSANGELVWEADAPIADDIAVDQWNNIFLSGAYRGALSVGDSDVSSNGADDFFVAKFEASGLGLWAVSGGATRGDHAQGLAVDHHGAPITIVDFSESFEFDGESVTNNGMQDILILKLE